MSSEEKKKRGVGQHGQIKYATKEEAAKAKQLQDLLYETKGMKKSKATVDDDYSIDAELDALTPSKQLQTFDLDDISKQLLLAKLDNLKERTTASREKSSAFRKKIWNAWSERFTDALESSFSIFKNDLINLRLNKEQLEILQTSLERALLKLEATIQAMCKNSKVNDDDLDEEEQDEQQ